MNDDSNEEEVYDTDECIIGLIKFVRRGELAEGEYDGMNFVIAEFDCQANGTKTVCFPFSQLDEVIAGLQHLQQNAKADLELLNLYKNE